MINCYNVNRTLLFILLSEFKDIELVEAGQIFASARMPEETAAKIVAKYGEKALSLRFPTVMVLNSADTADNATLNNFLFM